MDQVVHDDRLLRALWNNMVTEKFPSLTLAKRYLVFHLLHYALTSVPVTSSRLQILFSDHVMATMMKTVANKNDLFYSVSQKTLSAVCQGANEAGLQLELLQIFMRPPGSIQFDSITHTQTLATLVHQLTEEDAHRYFQLCLGHLYCDKPDPSSLSHDVRQRWAVHHLSLLASCASLHQRPLQSDVIKLLFLHSFFNVEKSCKETEHCERGPLAAVPDKSVVQLMKTTFVKTVDHVTSVSQSQRTEGATHDHMSRLNFGPMLDLVKYIQSLLDSGDVVALREGNAETVRAAWTKLKTATDALEKKPTKSHEDIAFLHLYLQFSHQLFSDAVATVDVLDDLLQCHKKLNTKRRKSVCKSDSEPEWVDVMTDMFLQLLSRNSHHVRRIVSVSYSLLAPHCTPASVHLMLDVLKSEGGEDEVMDFEDDSDSEEEAMDEEVDESSNHGDEEEESDDSSDEEDLAENGGVDEALRDALKQVLGEAKADSDEEESESDMSDTEMFKLDDALGKAFKGHLSKKKAEQDQRQQLMHFKIRVLDLISATVKHTLMKEELVMDILTTLVHLLCLSSKQKELKQLVAKISETIAILCKLRKIEIDHSCRDVPRVVDTLKQFLKASQKELAVSEDIKRACIFLVRLCTTDHHTQPSPARTRAKKTKQEADHKTTEDLCQAVQNMLRTSLLDYFYKRDPHLDPALYTQLFTGQTEFMVPLLVDLVHVVGDESVRIFCRSQACGMLNVAFNKKLADDQREDWEEFGQKLHSALEKAFVAAFEGDLKPKAVQVLLLCLNKYDLNFQQIISQEDLTLQERLLASVQDTKHKNKDIKKATASLQNMINRVKKTLSMVGPSSQQNGSPKKRRSSNDLNESPEKSGSETSSPSLKKKKKVSKE